MSTFKEDEDPYADKYGKVVDITDAEEHAKHFNESLESLSSEVTKMNKVH